MLVVTFSSYKVLIVKSINLFSMENLNYTCPKCSNKDYKIGQLRGTGGILSKIFDVQSQKYSSVTCTRCTFTEFYKAKTSALSNVFDFFTN